MGDAVELRVPSALALRLNDRRFYSSVSIAAATVVFAGFARSYYLKSFTDAAALTPLVHMHGAIFSAWFILLVVQVRLVALRRIAMHRQLGYAMAGLMVAMVVIGFLTVVAGARRGHTVPGVTPIAFMLGGLTNLLVFATLTTLAIAFRKRSAAHKRLMMLGVTGGLLVPAIARVPWLDEHPPIGLLLWILFLASGAVYDRWSRGKIHPVNKWVPVPVFLTVPLGVVLGPTAKWEAIGTWLIQ